MSIGQISGLVLAAGEGKRFGGPKALVEVDGQRLVDRAVRLLSDAGCAPVVVVAGAAQLSVPGARVAHNPLWSSGMGSSLRVGLETLRDDDVAAVVVTLVDQPWLTPEAVRRLQAAWADGAAVAVATYRGRRGHPVLLDRAVWDEVAASAAGDVGAKAFMTAHPELVTTVPCDDAGDDRDVDRPSDLIADAPRRDSDTR